MQEGMLATNRAYQAALRYLEIGLPVIPLCSPDHSGESFKHREICGSPGKAPVVMGWHERSSVTKEEIFKWFAAHSNRNIGLPLGNASRLIGIDVDGELGEQLLQKLSEGDLPETWEFTTGKGRRLLYALPQGVKVKKFKKTEEGRKHEELALLGDGQQTVLPPSIHVTGRKYEWVEGKSPFDREPALAPRWMLDLMVRQKKEEGNEEEEFSPPVSPDEWSGTVYEGERQDRLKRLAGSLLHRSTIPVEEVLAFLKHWNKTHCVPPWPEDELETLVRGLAFVEKSKTVNQEGSKDKLRPSFFARRFIDDQKAAGFSWHYSIKHGVFFRCDDTRGPWRVFDKQLVAKELREALVSEKEEWDFMRHQNEVMEALKEALVNPEVDEYLDLGQNILQRPQLLNYVSVANGLLDWQNMELHPWESGTYLTVQLPIEWDPKADCPTWKEALESWLPDPDVRSFIQEYVGLCLVPDTSFRVAVFLFGRGSNGKSLFIEGISKLFGDTIHFTPLHRLTERFETANLQNKLINVCSDIDPKYLAETGVLKALISGDKIMGEYKYGKSFHFTPVTRLLFSANELPKTRDKSEGWYSRWKLIEFPMKFVPSAQFKIKLLQALEEERSGMLNWALEGLRRLRIDNTFTEAHSMAEATHKYVIENDSVASFITERLLWEDTLKDAIDQGIVQVPAGKGKGEWGALGAFYISKEALYRYYRWFCGEYGLKPVNANEFSRQMRNFGIEAAPRPLKNSKGTVEKGRRVSSFLRIWVRPEHEREFNFVLMECM